MRNAPVFDLSGRVALVTGASSGLGERAARLLAESGAAVVMGARRVQRLEALANELASRGHRALAVEMDVSDEESTKAAFEKGEAAFGRINSVIANAGISFNTPSLDMTVEEFDQLFAVNMRGVFLTAREGARRMIASGSAEHGDGRIVLVSSASANAVFAGAAYSASKAGVVQFGRVFSRELCRRGINVNSILPGYIQTELTDDWLSSEAGRKQVSSFPRKRVMAESDLDAILLFLASDSSSGVTGSAFTVDDGQTL